MLFFEIYVIMKINLKTKGYVIQKKGYVIQKIRVLFDANVKNVYSSLESLNR